MAKTETTASETATVSEQPQQTPARMFAISETAVVAIRKALGKMEHDLVSPIISFLERSLQEVKIKQDQVTEQNSNTGS